MKPIKAIHVLYPDDYRIDAATVRSWAADYIADGDIEGPADADLKTLALQMEDIGKVGFGADSDFSESAPPVVRPHPRLAQVMIIQAVQFLAGQCDGAVKRDDVGFNGRDARYGHFLAGLDGWSPKQLHDAWRIIRRYHRQLAYINIDPLTIPEPPKPVPAAVAAKRAVRADDGWHLSFPYDAGLVDEVKAFFPIRRFVGDGKYWLIPAGDEPRLRMFVMNHPGFVIEASQ